MKQKQLRFFRDDEGAPRAEGFDADSGVLALFLESDIQDDEGLCRELLGRITARASRNDHPIEFLGNSFAANFGSDLVTLSSHVEGTAHTAMLDPHQVELALSGWLEFIET